MALLNGDKSSDKKKLVPKNQQQWTKDDLLGVLGFFRVDVEDAWASKDTAPPVVRGVLKFFTQIDEHYGQFDEDPDWIQTNNEADDDE